MSDLFTQTMNSKGVQEIADQDCRIWAERLMRDVNEEVSREERKERDFILAWIRSVQSSFEDFHSIPSPKLSAEIAKLLPA